MDPYTAVVQLRVIHGGKKSYQRPLVDTILDGLLLIDLLYDAVKRRPLTRCAHGAQCASELSMGCGSKGLLTGSRRRYDTRITSISNKRESI